MTLYFKIKKIAHQSEQSNKQVHDSTAAYGSQGFSRFLLLFAAASFFFVNT